MTGGKGLQGVKESRAASSQSAALQIADLRRQVVLLKEQRHDSEAELHTSKDAQRELRDTVDVLRSKLHSQGQREVCSYQIYIVFNPGTNYLIHQLALDSTRLRKPGTCVALREEMTRAQVDNMRRLAMFERLEPLFSKLGEMFTFRDPMEVIERLELLEDDKLGALSQMVPMQEEVATLGASLKTLQRRHAATLSNANTEHLHEMKRLRSSVADLQEELTRAQELVRCYFDDKLLPE